MQFAGTFLPAFLSCLSSVRWTSKLISLWTSNDRFMEVWKKCRKLQGWDEHILTWWSEINVQHWEGFFFFSTRLKDLFNINEHVDLQIHFFFFKYSDEFVWSWTPRSFVFLSHSAGGVAQLPDQLAKLIPSCRPQEPGCLLRPRQPSAGACPRFLKSLHQRWTHQFTHFLFSPALATQSAWSSVLFPRCVETLESSWIWACSRCLLASRPSRSCLAIPLSTSRVSRPRRSAHSHCIFCRWQGDIDGMTLIPHRDWRDYFPIPRQSEEWPNTTLRHIHFIKIPW